LKGTKKANLIVAFMVFAVVFLSLCAFAVDMTVFLTARGELQHASETTALMTASQLTSDSDNVAYARKVVSLFKLKGGLLQNLVLTSVSAKPEQKAVKIKIEAKVPTYFLGVLGLGYVTVQAQSSAQSSQINLDENLPLVLNQSGVIISKGPVMQDTKIIQPLTNFSEEIEIDYTSVLGEPDNKALSLGQGGYLTLRLPYPLVDKEGEDLSITEIGLEEGYYVFAGKDANSENPYLDETVSGDGIVWTNISCLAKTPLPRTFSRDNRAKVYGSATFDLGASCSDGSYSGDISYAQYLRIVDDNEENGFLDENSLTPQYFLGEGSGATAGADIDAVAILNRVKLIKSSDFDAL